MLLPSLPSVRRRPVALVDRVVTGLTAVSTGGLAAVNVADSGVFFAGLILRILFSWF
jgi:hypothetical protein